MWQYAVAIDCDKFIDSQTVQAGIVRRRRIRQESIYDDWYNRFGATFLSS